MITQNRLKQVLEYNENTGIFKWKQRISFCVHIGSRAGTTTHYGYEQIRIDGHAYHSHQLAWLYVYGEWPQKTIDHTNMNKRDNSIKNLRLVSNSENGRNQWNSKSNTSGVKGVCYHKAHKKWEARVYINSKLKVIGRSKDLNEAVCYRLAAEQCLDWDIVEQNSPAFQYVRKNIQQSVATL